MSDLYGYKKHPIYENYYGNEFGNIINSNLSCSRSCSIETSHDKNSVNYIYQHCIILNYYDRYEVIYHDIQFIWECFYGLIPSNKRVIIENNDDYYMKNIKILNNLKLIDLKYIPCKCEKNSILVKDIYDNIIDEIK